MKKMIGLYRWKTKDLHEDKWRHLETKKKHKQKTKVRTHFGDEKNNWIIWMKQKNYIETGRNILREKKITQTKD